MQSRTREKFQAEYAEYRESLLRRIAAAEVPDKILCAELGSESYPGPGPVPAAQPLQSQSQSYPAGCVLFARHVPPDTNEAALRKRFSALLVDAAALDYVDYTTSLDGVRIPFSLCD